MLKTPIGDIKMYFDDAEVDFEMKQIHSKTYPDVTTFHLKYHYTHDNKEHTLKCVLYDTKLKGEMEPGECLETIAFESINPCVRLSIGIEGEFLGYIYDEKGVLKPCYDTYTRYEGDYLKNGLQIDIENDDIQDFVFSVAWLCDYTDENGDITWYFADPSYRGQKIM